jgi:hypothetical protein
MENNTFDGARNAEDTISEVVTQLSEKDRLGRDPGVAKITDALWVLPDPQGAYFYSPSDDSSFDNGFVVALSKESLVNCGRAIDAATIDWGIEDDSLVVSGTKGHVVLTFTRESPDHAQRVIELSGKALSKFRTALRHMVE